MLDREPTAPIPLRSDEPAPGEDWGGSVVPAGHTVETGYVPIHDVVCRVGDGSQLLPAEVERAYRRALELGDGQGWPPPTGYWRPDGRFVLTDGRNRYVASLMLGARHLLVAWLRRPPAPPRPPAPRHEAR